MGPKNVIILCLLTPFITLGQGKNELEIHVKNGVLLNKLDAHHQEGPYSEGPDAFSEVQNTYLPGIGGSYTRILRSGILISGGLDFGYEKYAVKINYPFNLFGFNEPAIKGSKYNPEAIIPYAQLNVSLGYRVVRDWKIQPEIRIGQTVHSPLGYKRIREDSFETPNAGFSHNNFTMGATFGKPGSGTVIELLNSVYIGTSMTVNAKLLSKINIGIQAQKQLFTKGALNEYTITYYNANGFPKSVEEFDGTHTSTSLLVGFTF